MPVLIEKNIAGAIHLPIASRINLHLRMVKEKWKE